MNSIRAEEEEEEEKEKEPIRDLPGDVIVDILIRLPINYFSQARLVCKEWDALVTDHISVKKHMDRSNIIKSWYVAKGYRSSKISPYSLIHGGDGLLLMRRAWSQQFVLWNPMVRRILELPEVNGSLLGIVFCSIPGTSNYKVVSFYRDMATGEICCEVFAPGESNAWKPLSVPPDEEEAKLRGNTSIILTVGAVHLCILDMCKIISLDLASESFIVNETSQWERSDHCMEWDDKVALMKLNGEMAEVVVLEDYKKQRWCGEKKVIALPWNDESPMPLVGRKSEIWFTLDDKKLYIYSMETRKLRTDMAEEEFSQPSRFFSYKRTMLTFPGMVPEGDLETMRLTLDLST